MYIIFNHITKQNHIIKALKISEKIKIQNLLKMWDNNKSLYLEIKTRLFIEFHFF